MTTPTTTYAPIEDPADPPPPEIIATLNSGSCMRGGDGGQGQNRTGDTTIFSRMLYQLSYLAIPV